MTQPVQPKLPIPPQLLISEQDSFAYYTFTHRVPAIIEQVIAENNFATAIVKKLEALSQNLLQETVRPLKPDGGTDHQAWIEYIAPYRSRRWLDSPFYFTETYFYRRLLEAIAYFSVEPEYRIDPFELQKRLGLENAIKSVRSAVEQYQNFNRWQQKKGDRWQSAFLDLLYLNLWGNKADLSLNPTKAGGFDHENIEIHSQEESILINDAPVVADYISSREQPRIDFIVDNAGFELVSDLLLVDFLLTSEAVETAYLHLKSQPIFVSDAMTKDVHATLNYLASDRHQRVQAIALRLQDYLTSGRLKLIDRPFWTTPLFFWSMPQELQHDLAKSSLVFIKGDANYRRLVGDCHWAKTSSFADITCYFPAAFVALRTLKSEVIVGLKQNQIDKLNNQDANWQTNGKRGLIQFGKPLLPSSQ